MSTKAEQIIFSFRQAVTKIYFERLRNWESETRTMHSYKDSGLLKLLKGRHEFELKQALEEQVQRACSGPDAEMHELERLTMQLHTICAQILLEFNQKSKTG